MADVNIFNTYLLNIRTDYSNYVTNASNDLRDKGTRTLDQKIKISKVNYFTAHMHIMNSFDPTTTIHMLTAAQMQVSVDEINSLAGTSYEIDFRIYY